MSLLGQVKDKNGNTLTKSTSTSKSTTKNTPIDKARKEINDFFVTIEKKHGVKVVKANVTHLKSCNDSNLTDSFKIISKPIKANEKVGKNTIGVPFYKVYENVLFVEHTNICEEYTELVNGKEVLHIAKDEIIKTP